MRSSSVKRSEGIEVTYDASRIKMQPVESMFLLRYSAAFIGVVFCTCLLK